MRLSTKQTEATKPKIENFFGTSTELSPFCSPTQKQRGFTLVELITVLIIAGILAAAAIPRFFDSNSFSSRGFYDEVISTLRYAQKAAIAQRRFVCVTFTASSVTLTFDQTPPSASPTTASCTSQMTSPTGQTPYALAAPSGVTLSNYNNFNFSALGRPSFASKQSISVSGYAIPITVEVETGYVH